MSVPDTAATANPARGEAMIRVAGAALVLRASFQALVAAEKELGPLFALVERAADGRLGLGEMEGEAEEVPQREAVALTVGLRDGDVVVEEQPLPVPERVGDSVGLVVALELVHTLELSVALGLRVLVGHGEAAPCTNHPMRSQDKSQAGGILAVPAISPQSALG